MSIVPLYDYDPSLTKEKIRFQTYYAADAKDPDFRIRQELLLRLYQGDETVFEELGKHLFTPVTIGL